MAFQLFVTDRGTARIVAEKLFAGAELAVNTEPVIAKMIFDIMRITDTQFISEGRRGGGSWARLKPDTIRKKGTAEILKTEGARPKYKSLEGENLLYKSVTVEGAPFQILKFTRNSFEFGTNRPYAFVHQYGSPKRHIPARPFLRVLPPDQERWNRWIMRHLVTPFTGPKISR